MKDRIIEFINNIPLLRWLRITAKSTTLPGMHGIPVFYVAKQFKEILVSGKLSIRASAIAYDFFMAIFPAIIFLFTLTAYLPIPNFDILLLNAMQEVLPPASFLAVKNTILDIIGIQRDGLLSIGFILALVYANNGVASIITSFNASMYVKETRSFWSIRFMALVLTIILVLLLVSSILLTIFTHVGMNYLIKKQIISDGINVIAILIGKWMTFYALVFFSVSFLYYLGPSRKSRPGFFSPGALIVSALIIILLIGFSFFVSNFSTYNTVYGSVGALIALLVLINLIALLLLAGYEFNVGVYHLSIQRRAKSALLNNPDQI
jgi:membrane protein